jgi:7-keto-8-aminopelargonate synthetase-like enzyme
MSSSVLSPSLQQVDRTYVYFGRRKLSYLGGCDYFRLASHPEVLQALHDGLEKYGLNVAASRSTSGNHRLYGILESQLAKFFAAESAVLFSSGYVTNLAAAQALAGEVSHVLIDEAAHASLVDAASCFDCPVVKFRHCDVEDLNGTCRRIGKSARPMVLTDGMFSQNGEIAPLKAYLRILPEAACMLVDDAHGAGVLGKTGRGTLEEQGVDRTRIIQTIALSKAFGVYGGAVLCNRTMAARIQTRSRLFNGNTPLPLPLVNAALAAVQVLRADKTLRRRLRENTDYVKSVLRQVGFPIPNTPAPIVSLAPVRAQEIAELKKRFAAQGIYPSFIKYPGGPANGYFRFALSSEHTRAQLDAFLKVLVSF